MLRLDRNDELISASSPQYGDGEITTTFDLNSVGAIIKLVDPCGNKLTVVNRQWYVKTDPNQLPEEELVFESFEQVSRFVEGDQGQLLIEADDNCPRPEEYYAGVGEDPRVSNQEIAYEACGALCGCQHLRSCDKEQ
ncbi:MAG: hypothetical protein ACXAB9_15610 [Candidatus Thorarchaeota archaeon]